MVNTNYMLFSKSNTINLDLKDSTEKGKGLEKPDGQIIEGRASPDVKPFEGSDGNHSIDRVGEGSDSADENCQDILSKYI